MSVAEFQKSGGSLSGRKERVDVFSGVPGVSGAQRMSAAELKDSLAGGAHVLEAEGALMKGGRRGEGQGQPRSKKG